MSATLELLLLCCVSSLLTVPNYQIHSQEDTNLFPTAEF